MPLVYYIAYRAVSVKRFFKKKWFLLEMVFMPSPPYVKHWISNLLHTLDCSNLKTHSGVCLKTADARHPAQRAAGDMVIQSILRKAAASLESRLLPAQKRAFPYGMPFPPFFINYVDSFLWIFIGTYKSIWSYPSASLISSVGLSICPMALCPGRSSSSKPLLSIHFRIPA